MTLQDFFDMLAANPTYLLFFFFILPVGALLLGWISGQDGYRSPWSYLYAGFLYLACVPGIFAITLSLYFFLFEKRPILETNVYTQILPVISMVLTILIIKRQVSLDLIPGFGKLSGLMLMIGAAMGILWFIDRTHIVAITFIPFGYVVLMFVGLLSLLMLAWRMVTK